MLQFTVPTIGCNYLENKSLARALDQLCSPKAATADAILGIVLPVTFEACHDILTTSYPTELIVRTQAGGRRLPWYHENEFPVISQNLKQIAAAFREVVYAADPLLTEHMMDMNACCSDTTNSYAVILGKGCGFLKRYNPADQTILDAQRADDPSTIQAYVDAHCRVLVPASASNHAKLQAAVQGAELGALGSPTYHPDNFLELILTPVPERPENKA